MPRRGGSSGGVFAAPDLCETGVMCTLTRPAPGLLVGLPGGAPILVAIFVLVLTVPALLAWNYARNGGDLRGAARHRAFRFAVGGYLAFVVAQFLTDFLVIPTDAAVQGWSAQEYTYFYAHKCSTAPIADAMMQAQNTIAVVRVIVVIAGIIGLLLLALAYIYRPPAPKPE